MNAKLNPFFTAVAILLAITLGYWLYDISADEQAKWVVAAGGFLNFASTLIPLMGARYENARVAVSVRTASALFLVIMLIENFCFAGFGVRTPIYIIVAALTMLIAVAVVYKLSQINDM